MKTRLVVLIFVFGLVLSACSLPMPPSDEVPVAETAIPQSEQVSEEAPVVEEPEEALAENPPVLVSSDSWHIEYFDGATDEMHGWAINELDPAGWSVFPNVDNDQYPASQGVEYGEDLSAFCQQNQTCDFNVAALHYRLYTGDYDFSEVSCKSEDGKGCALIVVNVGNVTAMWRDQHFDYGFTVTGRYWDGNFLPQAMWAVMSHASANMLNMNTTLNPGGTNAGANCSVPEACSSVDATFVVTSGNEILMIGHSEVSK